MANEEKFIIINKKHLENVPLMKRLKFYGAMTLIEEYLPNNKYYVCNQDEPYAEKVFKLILDGEDLKKEN